MDTTDPDITFDAGGICRYCHWYEHRIRTEALVGEQRDRRLGLLVEQIRKAGRGKDYDCAVGVSGGVDSSTVLRRAKLLGLRPLAVHFDNGWNSALAVVNLKRLLDKLNVDLYTCVVDWEEFRDLQLAFLRSGVPNCEIPTDHGISATMWRAASRYKLKYILTGTNVVTEAFMPRAWTYDALDLRHLHAIHRKFGHVPLETFPTLGPLRWMYYVAFRGIRAANLLNYIDYDKTKEKKELIDNFGWTDYGGKHYESIFTRFYQGYYLPRRFGFDKRRAHLSCLILAGQLTRAAALEELGQEPYTPALLKHDLAFVVKKFGMSADEFEQFVCAPQKRHKEYPNLELVFYRVTWIRSLFKQIAMKM